MATKRRTDLSIEELKKMPRDFMTSEAYTKLPESVTWNRRVENVVKTGRTHKVNLAGGEVVAIVAGEEYDILLELAEFAEFFKPYLESHGAPSAEPVAWQLFAKAVRRLRSMEEVQKEAVSLKVVDLLRISEDLQ